MGFVGMHSSFYTAIHDQVCVASSQINLSADKSLCIAAVHTVVEGCTIMRHSTTPRYAHDTTNDACYERLYYDEPVIY